VSIADRREYGDSGVMSDDLLTIVRVIGGSTVAIMADGGIDFTNRHHVIEEMLALGTPNWFDALELHPALLPSFIADLPARDKLDAAAIKKLQRLIRFTTSLAVARPVFERLYAPLDDTTYDATSLRTRAWNAHDVHHLYETIDANLPLAHVRGITAFHIGTQEMKKGVWKDLNYGWWTGSGRVVLPSFAVARKTAEERRETPSKKDDKGHVDHDMTGGSQAQDPKAKKGTGVADYFDITILHEVGHDVGGKLGGHAWAEKLPYVDWKTSMTTDAWSKGLWGNDAQLTARATQRAGAGGRVVPADQARHYLANNLTGAALLPAGWDIDKYEAAILAQYGDQKLTQYYVKWHADSEKDDSYTFAGTDNYGSDDRVYVYLSRGGAQLASYKQKAHQEKVSWYSLASPHEWFAEQYAHYYRTGKAGTGLDPVVKTKLDELDLQSPENPPKAAAAPAAPGGGAAHSEGGQSEASPTGHDDDRHRLPFPW
jgi:hypothetical protein